MPGIFLNVLSVGTIIIHVYTREQGVSSESILHVEYMQLKWLSETDHIAFVSGVISKHVGTTRYQTACSLFFFS